VTADWCFDAGGWAAEVDTETVERDSGQSEVPSTTRGERPVIG